MRDQERRCQKWINDIRGYIDRGKFVVNLACKYGPHLLVSFVHPVGGEGME